MEIDTRITDIYIHAYIHIREPSSSTDLNFIIQFEGRESLRRGFPKYSLSLFLLESFFFSSEEEGREEVTLLQKSPVRGKCEYDVSYPFYSACKYTRGKRIRGVGPRTYFTHHGRSASVPAKGGFILSRFTMLYGVGLAASTNNCQLNVPSIDLVPRISFLSC